MSKAEQERAQIIAWLERGGQWDSEMQSYARAFAAAIKCGVHLSRRVPDSSEGPKHDR